MPTNVAPARTSWLSRVAALVAYMVVTAVMTWPFVNYQDFAKASYGGDARLIIWTLAWDNHSVLSGLPLFDSNIFFPTPDSLRYNEHLLGVSLATLPWSALGASPVLAYNATWLLAFLLNGLATFAWLRRFVASSVAAFAGSLVFTCSSYIWLHAHGHLHLIWIWPLPLSALLLERWFARPTLWRTTAWLAAALMGVMTSWYYAVMVGVVNAAVAGVLVVAAIRGRSGDTSDASRLWSRRALHLAAAAVVAATCVWPLARHYVGMTARAEEAVAYSATPSAYVIPPENTLVGRWWERTIDDRPGSIYGETTVFAGWIALALGLTGLAGASRRVVGTARVRDSAVLWAFPVLALVGFLLSLGPSPPALGGPALAPFGWLTSLPGFSGMRAPARFALVGMLGWSGLAALGAQAFVDRWRGGTLVVAVLVPFMLAEWFVVGFPAGKPEVHAIPEIYRTAELQTARSLVSLPEYRDQDDWFRGGDYLYYSTAHWRPIVNGFGRSEPPTQPVVVAAVRNFAKNPLAVSALGIQYIVVHRDRLPRADRGIVEEALANPQCRLVRQVGSDYLFEVGS